MKITDDTETKTYEWLESFCSGSQGWEVSMKNRSLATRSLSRRVGNKQSIGKNLVGELILEICGLVGRGNAEERVGWHSRERWSTAYTNDVTLCRVRQDDISEAEISNSHNTQSGHFIVHWNQSFKF